MDLLRSGASTLPANSSSSSQQEISLLALSPTTSAALEQPAPRVVIVAAHEGEEDDDVKSISVEDEDAEDAEEETEDVVMVESLRENSSGTASPSTMNARSPRAPLSYPVASASISTFSARSADSPPLSPVPPARSHSLISTTTTTATSSDNNQNGDGSSGSDNGISEDMLHVPQSQSTPKSQRHHPPPLSPLDLLQSTMSALTSPASSPSNIQRTNRGMPGHTPLNTPTHVEERDRDPEAYMHGGPRHQAVSVDQFASILSSQVNELGEEKVNADDEIGGLQQDHPAAVAVSRDGSFVVSFANQCRYVSVWRLTAFPRFCMCSSRCPVKPKWISQCYQCGCCKWSRQERKSRTKVVVLPVFLIFLIRILNLFSPPLSTMYALPCSII